MEDRHPYGPPELTMLACGIITPTKISVSRVTTDGYAAHSTSAPARTTHSVVMPSGRFVHSSTVTMSSGADNPNHGYAPRPRLLERAITVFSYTVVFGFILTLLAEVVRLCAGRGGL